MALWGWERFFEETESFVTDLNRRAGAANESYCEYAIERLETCISSVSSLVDLLRSRQLETDGEVAHLSVQLAELLQCLRGMHVEWQAFIDGFQHVSPASTSYTAPIILSSGQGRPRFDITHEQLQYLRSMSFSWVQIAKLLGVSIMTIYRRRQEFRMTGNDGTNITDSELREVLRQLRQELPSLGQTLAWGRLRSMGFKVRRERLRQAMREIDPIHTALRWRGELVQRQPYSVPGPNSLWHIGELMNYLF